MVACVMDTSPKAPKISNGEAALLIGLTQPRRLHQAEGCFALGTTTLHQLQRLSGNLTPVATLRKREFDDLSLTSLS
ncbi:hypothetical protein NIES4103_06480 [Nostoc sp. NIES-4103]|nr:hypothetical protein NIES4103_06480 [Nostoc sp. NIES-4103]